jgi:hypothetical protein
MRTALFSLLLLALISAFTTKDEHKIEKKDDLILVDGTPIPEGATEVLCEIDGMSLKWIARLFLEYNVLDEKGALIEANLQRMAVHMGKAFSAKPTIISY